MVKKFFILTAISFCAISFGVSFHKKDIASAVTAGDWRAGRIIDDFVFTNKNSMGVDQIQALLNAKVGTGGYDSLPRQCDTNGSRNATPFSNSTRAQYAASLGRSSTFTCLSNYYEVPKTSPGPGTPASNYGGAPIPTGAKSAAQLIYDAAQTYNISPMVLLVKIQQESAGPLTTDDWPFQKQYTYAMGAHCPDSGPGGAANCDSNYAGFSIQVAESASLLRYYLDNMSQPWWPYKKLGNNDILYQNTKPECGSSTVNITTKATAALYTYTPYQPNQAALNNLYGTGDGCSAYGNRNFWRIFSDWFGSTYDPTYNSAFQSQTNPPSLLPGQTGPVKIAYKNTGGSPWKDDGSVTPGYFPIHLAITNPINHASRFATVGWLNAGRTGSFTKVYEADGSTLSADQHTVLPGQVGSFEFNVTVPSDLAPGAYRETIQPIAEGAPNWVMGGWGFFEVNVK